MLSYFVARGHRLDYLLNLDYTEKIFFMETMARELELEAKKGEVINKIKIYDFRQEYICSNFGLNKYLTT